MAYKTPGAESEYIRARLAPETDSLLMEMTARAEEMNIPSLLPESAAFLRAEVEALRPGVALEIGTAIGYSAMLMLSSGCGRVFTVEMNEERAAEAEHYFARAGLADRATVFTGDATEIVPMIDGAFDLVFMDGPKTSYPVLFPHILKLLKVGGVLIADNVLWNGCFAGGGPRKKATIIEGVDRFTEMACSSPALTTSILPVGDGMIFAVKRREAL